MRGEFDRRDLHAAFGLFVGVAAWAFIWAHPFPHPDLWPFLTAVQGRIGVTALGIVGRFALGGFAVLVYFVLRGLWFLHRDRDDELPDGFYTRASPICGAAIFALLPQSWRAGQFLSPGFALLVLSLLGFLLWLRGRGGRECVSYALAYLFFGFVCGLNPVGILPLGFIWTSDTILRWRDNQIHDQRTDDDLARRKRAVEAWFASLASLAGFSMGVRILSWFAIREGLSLDLVRGVFALWAAWSGNALRAVVSPEAVALALSVLVAVVGLAIGRRIRAVGSHGLLACRVLAGALALVAFTMLLRSVDWAERIRLRAIREYVAFVADDAEGARYLFTDGRFDDALRLEFARRGRDVVLLNTVAAPSPEEAVRLRALAPEPGDRALFEAGGAEVFRAWAQERADRLAASAWQLGSGIVRRYGKVDQRTHGSVLRCADATRAAEYDKADARFAEWTLRLGAIAEGRAFCGALFGGTDDAVAKRFDALLWRAARLAGERSDRRMMQRLDELNASLKAQGEAVERMLPTGKLVLTAREGLEIALKRADFELATRYANEVLVGDPENSAANFALGMASLEAKEHFRAATYLERALAKNPNEPATLNNLAIAYARQGRFDEALRIAERAAKILPNAPEIQKTLSEIRRRREPGGGGSASK